MRRLSVEMSRAVVTCAGLGRPDAFLNVDFDMPMARAVRVILAAKLASVPSRFSPMAVAISLADLVTRTLMASSTEMVAPGINPSFVGCMLAAHFDTLRSLVNLRR